MKILIVKLGSIGDVVHAMPAVTRLRRALPTAQIDWLVERYAAAALSYAKNVDHVRIIDTLRWRRAYWKPSVWSEIRAIVKLLRKESYEAALDLQGLWKSAVLARLSHPHQVWGWNRGFLREPLSSVLYSKRLNRGSEVENVVFEHWRVVNAFLESAAGAVSEPPADAKKRIEFDRLCSESERRWAQEQLRQWSFREFVIVNPGANWKSKLWPAENYALLAKRIFRTWGWPVVITAGPTELPLAQRVLGLLNSTPAFVMQASLPQLAALAEKARLFIGADTGPLHIAAAVGTPIVGIFASTDPRRNGPVNPDDVVVRRNRCGRFCYRRDCGARQCISMITVDEVFQAVRTRSERIPV